MGTRQSQCPPDRRRARDWGPPERPQWRGSRPGRSRSWRRVPRKGPVHPRHEAGAVEGDQGASRGRTATGRPVGDLEVQDRMDGDGGRPDQGSRGVESVEIEEVLPQHEIEARLPADLRGPWGLEDLQVPIPHPEDEDRHLDGSFAIQVDPDGLGRDGIARVRQDAELRQCGGLDSRLDAPGPAGNVGLDACCADPRRRLDRIQERPRCGRVPGTAGPEHLGQDPVVDPPDRGPGHEPRHGWIRGGEEARPSAEGEVHVEGDELPAAIAGIVDQVPVVAVPHTEGVPFGDARAGADVPEELLHVKDPADRRVEGGIRGDLRVHDLREGEEGLPDILGPADRVGEVAP